MSDKRRKKDADTPLTEEEAYRKAMGRGTRYRLLGVNPGLIICAAFLCAIIAVCAAVIVNRGTRPTVPSGSGVPSTAEVSNVGGTQLSASDTVGSDQTIGDSTPAPTGMTTVTAENIHAGELILVNADHEYVFPDVPTDVSVYENKTKAYKVSDLEVTLSMNAITPFNRLMDDFYAVSECGDVLVVSGFRTEEFQRQLYADRVASQGVEAAAKYVALPGQSEHHTGLAMDLSVYTASGDGYYVREYEKCKWLVENFENYGFVLRYPEEKAALTGISYESWHYRYVGLPHSLVMKEKNFCLEEYIDYIHEFTDGKMLAWENGASHEAQSFTGTDGAYLVWYVPATDGKAQVSVPWDRTYRISGDNIAGFVVTVDPCA